MDSHLSIGVASSELADPDGLGPPRAGRALPSVWRPLLEASRLHLLPREVRGRGFRGRTGPVVNAGWVPATAVIARRAAVEDAGLLDESFFMYGEDIEWCWRMQGAGWRIGVCGSVTARHRQSSSALRSFATDEARLMIARGEMRAVRAIRGPIHLPLYMLVTAFALRIESLHPRRSHEWRAHARDFSKAWWKALRSVDGWL